jgi:hypothetical protein
MLVVKQQTKRKSANRQVTTPSVKPNCVEANLPFDLLQPVRIDHPSICTSDTALPSDELLEPPLAPDKEPTTHAIQVGDASDKENSRLVTTTSTTKEPTLAGEILMVNDCLETHEDGDLTTVVLVDKGKGVDPQEYGASYYPNSMIVPAGTNSTGGSDSIELIGVHRDKGKNVDPEEKGNGMTKYDPGPSRIDFDDHRNEAISFQKQSTPLESFDPTKILNDELPYDPTLPRRSWRPKISHFRFIVCSVPLAFLGTVQAGSNQKGRITPEWISGVVIFLLNLGPLILYLRVPILASASMLPSVIRYHTGRFIGAIERRASFRPLPFPMAVLIQTSKSPKDIL